jgi:small subunit ribosomal protein S5
MAEFGNNPRGARGPRVEEEKQFDERVVNIDRVARVVKGGRRFRFRALVVVGDRKGSVGIGISKGADVTTAVAKAVDVAKKNMVKIVKYKDTIPHEVEAKVGGAKILIMPASAGTGLIAGGTVRTILEVAGVSNALSKSLGSSNKINIAYATIDALQLLVPANKWVTADKSNSKKPSKTAKAEGKSEKAEV